MPTLPVPDLIEFKFQFIRDGKAVGWKKRGLLDESRLVLDKQEIPLTGVTRVIRVRRRLLIQYVEPDSDGQPTSWSVAVGVYGRWFAMVKRKLDLSIATRLLEEARDQCRDRGQPNEFRSQACPHCGCGIDLTGLPRTTYIYCPFCETVFNDSGICTCGDDYGVCGTCGLFGRIVDFTEWYFFFLLVFWYFQTREHRLCTSCRSSLRWGMFWASLGGLVSIFPYLFTRLLTARPPSRVQRALRRGGRLARKGKPDAAGNAYGPAYDRWPDHPGLLFNEITACFKVGDQRGTEDRSERLFRACSSYYPAEELLRRNSAPAALAAAAQADAV
ncbi:MAG: hypothetical protein PHU85_03635 [Phycisphaerae bacterium]|nr:hypothetical protein [Phycisphaerae bacterium]